MNKKDNFKEPFMYGALAFITLLGYLLLNSYSFFEIPGSEAMGHFFIGLLISILSGWFAVVIWNVVIKQEKIDDTKLLIDEIHKQIGGLKVIEISDAYEKAGDFITNCTSIRIIGAPDTSKDPINKYLQRTSETIKANQQIKYKRICPVHISEQFENHISEILEKNDDQIQR